MSRIEAELIAEARFQAQRRAKNDTDEAKSMYLLRTYAPRVEAGYACPMCHVAREQLGLLRSVPSSSPDDIMVCNTCDREVVIPG